MTEESELIELCGVYEGMNTEGKKKMILTAYRLLDAQKVMREPVVFSKFLSNADEQSVNVPAVYDVLPARIRALRSIKRGTFG